MTLGKTPRLVFLRGASKSPAPKNYRFKTIIVSLKSAQAHNHVINQKRSERDLGIKELFSYINSKIYVNEVLTSDTYAVLTRTNTRGKELDYKYVWVRSGKIAVRRAEGQPIIFITTVQDIERLA